MSKRNLKVGDVVRVEVAGWGLGERDVGKFVKVIDFDSHRSLDVVGFECELETYRIPASADLLKGVHVVDIETFGDKPVFYNPLSLDINAVELLPKGDVKQDVGKHYRYSFRLNLTQDDIDKGFVMVNLDPYRISTVYNLGGWREHLVKKGIRGTEKGHTEKELLDELQCILDRAKQMYEESCG